MFIKKKTALLIALTCTLTSIGVSAGIEDELKALAGTIVRENYNYMLVRACAGVVGTFMGCTGVYAVYRATDTATTGINTKTWRDYVKPTALATFGGVSLIYGFLLIRGEGKYTDFLYQNITK